MEPAPGEARHSDVHLTLCLTHACNLRCRYCYAGVKTARHMTEATGLAAIELALARVTARLHLVFFGGEPLLRFPLLARLTAEARRRAAARGVELRPTVTTNATLLGRARAAWLAAEGFVVAVSCDGVAAAHDANRVDRLGRPTFERTAAGLERALAAGARVRVVLVLDPATVDHLPASIAELRRRGARDFVVSPNWSADWRDAALRARTEAAVAAVARDYAAAYGAGDPFWISTLDDKIHAHIQGGHAPSERCDLGRKNLVVAPGGNLYPCDRLVADDADGRFAIGHVDRGADPARLRALTGPVVDVPADCVSCAVARRCRNRCACANYAQTGRLDVPSEALCFHEQLAIRAADAAARQLVAERNALFLRRHYGDVLS